jgi:hypothetical protein
MVDDVSAEAREEWRPVVGYEGLYEVSNLGRIKGIKLSPEFPEARILKPSKQRAGYLTVSLSDWPSQKTRMIHQLVAESFLGKRPIGKQINHKDGVKAHNELRNLEYITVQENQNHALRLGLSVNGEHHHWSKLTARDVLEIRAVASYVTRRKLMELYGISKSMVGCILRREAWRHLPENATPNEAEKFCVARDGV